MHIHKPKSWAGLREFLKEYAVIVVGILTALGGEQLIEALNRAHDATATEAALRQEVGDSLINAAERVMETKCLSARLGELSQALGRGGGAWRANALEPPPTLAPGRPDVGFRSVYRAPTRPWISNSWQAVLASGSVAHLSETQLRIFGGYYRSVEILRDTSDREDALAPAVQPLAYDQTLSADKRFEMQAKLAELDRLNDEMTLSASQFIERARRNGLEPDAAKLDARFQLDSKHRGDCVQRLGSTADSLPADAR